LREILAPLAGEDEKKDESTDKKQFGESA
jgi:hypothetical protein